MSGQQQYSSRHQHYDNRHQQYDNRNVSANPMSLEYVLNSEPVYLPDWALEAEAALQKDARRRDSRPPYTDEEQAFLWYHRVDLDNNWDTVKQLYRLQFPERSTGGLQCRFYRTLEAQGCPAVRNRTSGRRQRDRHEPRFGVIEWTTWRYPWMRLEHIHQPPLRRPTHRQTGMR